MKTKRGFYIKYIGALSFFVRLGPIGAFVIGPIGIVQFGKSVYLEEK